MADATVIGIDLGTTNSCVAVWRNGRVNILANSEGYRVTPSTVSFTDGATLVGNAAARKMLTNLDNTVFDMKRLLGKKFSDENVQKHMKYWPFKVTSNDNDGRPVVLVNINKTETKLRPLDISAKVLIKMKETAERVVQNKVDKAVITVPAYFNQTQKMETIEAAKLAGLQILELITEPSAAAYAYGFDNKKFDNYKILVFDLGGGTFDVSVIEVSGGCFKVLAIGGDTNLGGRDFDHVIFDYCNQQILHLHGKDCFSNKKLRQKLLSMCVKLKIALSSSTEDSIYLGDLFADLEEEIIVSRDDFETRCKQLIEKTMQITLKTLEEAKLNKQDVNEVLLIGVNVDEAVAFGAAIRAAQLCETTKSEIKPNITLVEATPLSLGTSVVGNRFYAMILQNSQLPTKAEMTFITIFNDQQDMDFSIYEGERKLVQHNNYLGNFSISGLSKGVARSVSVKLVLELDKNGILHAHASHNNVEASLQLEYKQKHILEQHTIEEMLRDGKIFKEQDQTEYDRISAQINLQVAIRKVQYEVENSEMSAVDKQKKDNKCREYEKWIKENDNASAQVYASQLNSFITACK